MSISFLMLVCCAIVSVANAGYDPKMIPEHLRSWFSEGRDKCIAETGVAVDLINSVNDRMEFPDDQHLKCYVKCIMMFIKSMNEDGVFNGDILDDKLSDHPEVHNYRQMFETCKDITDEKELCSRAYEFHRCVATRWPNLYYLL